MEIEFSRVCNFRCPYCYVDDMPSQADEMTVAEIRDVLVQARELGARKIIVLGGEPMVYPRLFEMVDFIRDQGMAIEMFTNGSRMDAAAARFLFERGVKVVLKMNTRDPQLQDVLSGFKGAHRIIRGAFDRLRAAGYPAPGKALAISSIICQYNIGELEEFWRWLRDRDIEPYFEMLTPQGRADRNRDLQVDSAALQGLFERIAAIDRSEYGRDWQPQPPLVGNRCLRHRFSALVTAGGDVLPCVGVTIPVGNVRRRKLREILEESEVVQDLRNYRQTLVGPCARCERAATCYGCRGAAYQVTGDYRASDPLCWKNRAYDRQAWSFPHEAAPYLPQKDPMRLVDQLLAVGERTAKARLTVRADSPFVFGDGTLDEACYLEIIAQTMAALDGFRHVADDGKTLPAGFLLGARHLAIHGRARSGDCLDVEVFKETKLGDFGIVRGSVRCGDRLLAQGEIKVWHDSGALEATKPAIEKPDGACDITSPTCL